ncbi:recombination regulator RecX [Aromatoleum bremense]|uniref:Regulatory protein RecX n=1 Tax=Aromatoleum bremense TaxID=76115 RepID=A0ABX1NU50_9RHOO|nr:recombination regulator RecX [Aromatoleum bremense]NMG15531.1 recombination regulator RecX [Aromatoleum bremense]QTQ31569.1 Regulatory protein [Aromatoleum bremense]
MPEISLRERAVRHLARRDHSRAELARKLAPHGSAEEIDDVLNRMHELELLSDRRFAEAWVRSKAARFGTARLRHDLAQRGVARETIDAALAVEGGCTDFDRARQVWSSRFGAAPADAREWAKQARFLQGRGFGGDVIRKVLNETPDESA